MPAPTATASKACIVNVPQSWQHAITAGQIPLDHPINNVISVNADTGDYLVEQIRPATAGGSGQVTLAAFHGKTGQDVAQLPGNGSTEALADGAAAITPDWIAYGLYQPGGNNGYRTALLYNRHTRQSIVLADRDSVQGTNGQLNGAPILFDGKAYWVEASYPDHRGVVQSYDLASGVRASKPVNQAVNLVYYGTGLAVVTQSDQGSTLANYAGAALAPAALQAAADGGYFTYDGSTLRWWSYTANPFLQVLYTNRPGSAHVVRQPVDGQNMSGVATWPFIEVARTDPSPPIWDLRSYVMLSVPTGLNVQAVIGDQVLIGTGATALGNGGLSLVPLTALPPEYC
jgi:hypothetical protein